MDRGMGTGKPGLERNRKNTLMDKGQAVYNNDKRTLTPSLCSKWSRKPNHNLCSHYSSMVRTWSMMPTLEFLPLLPPLFPAQDQSEKAKYVLQTNHVRCFISSKPALDFPMPNISSPKVPKSFLFFFSFFFSL